MTVVNIALEGCPGIGCEAKALRMPVYDKQDDDKDDDDDNDDDDDDNDNRRT